MPRFLLAAVLLMLSLGTAHAAPACDATRNDFDGVYCLAQAFEQADQTLNADFVKLRAKLPADRQKALRSDEIAWLKVRDQNCSRHTGDGFFVDLACAGRMTTAHSEFLEARYRTCVAAACPDLDFYNTQDVTQPEQGPKLTRYPATSKYQGADAGYVAVYTHDPANALYAVGNFYVAGFIRLRGRYEGTIFRPEGYATKDISADADFKKLTEASFPGRQGGTWAGGDTGGLVGE